MRKLVRRLVTAFFVLFFVLLVYFIVAPFEFQVGEFYWAQSTNLTHDGEPQHAQVNLMGTRTFCLFRGNHFRGLLLTSVEDMPSTAVNFRIRGDGDYLWFILEHNGHITSVAHGTIRADFSLRELEMSVITTNNERVSITALRRERL